MKKLKVAINVPSGKLVCGNDFREQYPIKEDYYINETLGIKLTIEEYAKMGLFHGYVGNTCPGLYLKNGQIKIASLNWDKKKPKEFGKRVGGICTNLWWYSIADHDDYIKRGGIIHKNVDVVKVKPGRYILSHDLERDFDDYPVTFATIERSDEKIKPWKLPEEGAVEEIMKLLPEKFLGRKCIYNPPPRGSTKSDISAWQSNFRNRYVRETSLFVKTVYEKLATGDCTTRQKKIGYELWGSLYAGDKEHFIRGVVVNDKQIQDYEYMAKRAIDSFEKQAALKEWYDELFSKNKTKMSSKERKAYEEEMIKYFEKELREDK